MIDAQSKLSDALKKIFNLKRVVFDVIDNNIEQDVLICEIVTDDSKFYKDFAHIVLSGEIGFRGQNVNNPLGYLKDRLAQASNNELNGFRFSNQVKKTSALFIGQSFTTQTMEFTYTVDIQYDTVNKIIEFKDLVFKILGIGRKNNE